MNPNLIIYAQKILFDTGCDKHTYGGDQAKNIMDDLKKAFPNGMDYPYVDVANAILALSRPKPIKRAPFKVVWATGNASDAFDVDSDIGDARAEAVGLLMQRMDEARDNWTDRSNPTNDEITAWNNMIWECTVEVQQYQPKTDEYVAVWSPDDNELRGYGWHEWGAIPEPYRISIEVGEDRETVPFVGSLEAAVGQALDKYQEWMQEAQGEWESPDPNEEQISAWDAMIANNRVRIFEYDDMCGEYVPCGEPSSDTLEEIGWRPWEPVS